jgi:hypothetical protein
MYFDQANNYWVAAVSLGHKGGKRVRRKVFGRTKTEVKAKLRELRRDMENGVRSGASYTVNAAQPPFGTRERGFAVVATVYSRLLCIAAFYWPWPQFAELTVRAGVRPSGEAVSRRRGWLFQAAVWLTLVVSGGVSRLQCLSVLRVRARRWRGRMRGTGIAVRPGMPSRWR